jgi:hypothetical protein
VRYLKRRWPSNHPDFPYSGVLQDFLGMTANFKVATILVLSAKAYNLAASAFIHLFCSFFRTSLSEFTIPSLRMSIQACKDK